MIPLTFEAWWATQDPAIQSQAQPEQWERCWNAAVRATLLETVFSDEAMGRRHGALSENREGPVEK